MEEIIIDFNQSDYSDAAACPISSLIHQSQMEQIMKLVDKLYQKSKNAKRGVDEFSVKHDTISIFASRGAGKTTFLLTTLEQIRKKYDRIVCLNTIDPSTIENKQHPFINIIASIQEEVERYFSASNLYNYHKDDFAQRKDFEDCYKKLLKGLPVIDGIGKGNVYDDWNDEEFISIKGMEKAELSNKLNQLFHKYVRKALNLIDKDCFVISFDDIDTDFKKGFQLLEVIRKYLTSSQIITILTGDLELYGKLVRKANWQCFSQDFLKKEIEYANRTKDEFAGMINQLENQYLVKILKPEYRIHLKTIYENNIENNYDLVITYSNEKEKRKIKDCYKYILDKTGFSSQNIKVTNSLIQYLEGLSTRIQIRLLTLANNCVSSKEEKDEQIASEVMDIFWNDILQKSSNAKSLLNKDQFYVVEMLKFLLNSNALHIGTNFMPITNDITLNKALLAIGAKFNEQVKDNPFMIFDFWLRICYVQFISEQLGNKQDIDDIQDFLDFTGLDTHDDLIHPIGLSHAYCNYKFNLNNHYFSNKSISGTSILSSFIPEYRNKEDYLLAMLPLVGSMDETMNETSFVSIYKLLAIIRDILFHIEEHIEKKENLYLLVNKLIQYKFYIEPVTKDKVQLIQAQLNQEREYNLFIEYEENGNRINQLIRELTVWFLKLKKKRIKLSNCSPQLLSRIFTRFYFTLINIDKANNYKNAGDQLHSCIIALLNATMIEEGIDKNILDLNLSTTENIDNIFIDNVDKFYKTLNTNDTLYFWLASCPILKLFLNPYILELLDNTEDSQFISEKLKYNRSKMTLDFLHKREDYYTSRINKLNAAKKWLKKYIQYKDTTTELNLFNSYATSVKIKNSDDSFNTLQYVINKQKMTQKQRDNLSEYLVNNVIVLPEDKCDLSMQMSENEYLTALSTISRSIDSINKKIARNNDLIDKEEKKLSEIKDFVKRENIHINNPIYQYLCQVETKQLEKNLNVPNFDYEFFD